ncbi:MAG: MerR family transcriptional regulator, partial [Myxococcota bacterium]
MRRDEQIDPHIYRIGAVSRLTSIPTGTIRVWERRYGVVAPGRSDGGFRLYSHRDVERLRVIKSLIESGETISGLADLDLSQLRHRLRAHGIDEPEPIQHPLELDAAAANGGTNSQ